MNRGVLLLKRSHQALHHYKVKMLLTKATSMLGTSVMKVSAMMMMMMLMMMMMMDNGDGEDDEGHLNAWYVSECSSHEGALDRLLHYVSAPGVSSSLLWSL